MKPQIAKILSIILIIMAILFAVLSLPMLIIEKGLFIFCIIFFAFCLWLSHYIKKKYIL